MRRDLDYARLSEPSRDTTLRLSELCDALAAELADEVGGDEDWHKDASEHFYAALFDSIGEVEIPTPRTREEDARLEAGRYMAQDA